MADDLHHGWNHNCVSLWLVCPLEEEQSLPQPYELFDLDVACMSFGRSSRSAVQTSHTFSHFVFEGPVVQVHVGALQEGLQCRFNIQVCSADLRYG